MIDVSMNETQLQQIVLQNADLLQIACSSLFVYVASNLHCLFICYCRTLMEARIVHQKLLMQQFQYLLANAQEAFCDTLLDFYKYIFAQLERCHMSPPEDVWDMTNLSTSLISIAQANNRIATNCG